MIPIIDSGHGYNTPGKRSIFHTTIFKGREIPLLKENCVNESVANKFSYSLYKEGIENYFISNEWWDISLEERCRRENEIFRKLQSRGKSSFFMSIHADAFHEKNKAAGGTFFYKSESGRKLAYHFTEYLENNGYGIRLRKPKKANFKVLRSTDSPAILFELGFMTTKSDLDILRTDNFRNRTADLLTQATCLL